MRATISILGLTDFNPEVWNQLVLPEEAESHREDLIDEICMECSDLELLYPDWNVMKRAIGRWSKHELPIWTRLYAAKALKYQPLWNVEEYRQEVRDTRDDGEHSKSLSGQDSRTGSTTGTAGETLAEDISRNKELESDGTTSGNKSGTHSEQTTGTEDVDTTNKSNSFNSGTMIDNNQQIVDRDTSSNRSGTDSETTSGTAHDEGTETESVDRDQTINRTSKDDTTESGTHSESESGTTANQRHDVYTVNRHGNIGVTSSQDLLKQEWEVSQLDPEQVIIDSFKQHFCLMVY